MLSNKPLQVLSNSGFQSVLDTVGELCDLWLKYVDVSGEHIISSSRKEPCQFCKIIRSTPKGMARCLSSAEKVMKNRNNEVKPFHYICHAGLTQLAVPVIYDHKPVGVLICGEIVEDTDLDKGVKRMLELTADLSLNQKDLINAYRYIPRWNRGKLQKVSQLLETIGYCLTQVNHTYMNEEKVSLERSLKVMELKALQAQINPHFLFNTLNIISILAMLENAEETQKVVRAFASLLKNNLQNDSSITTIDKELTNVDDYLFIQKKRFGPRLQIFKDIDPAILQVSIPVLTLQPLVENAIVHGLEPKEGQGHLIIRGWAEHDTVYLSVEDDGQGMSIEKLNDIKSKICSVSQSCNSIGLFNVNKRLKLIYGQDYGLSLTSIEHKGTKATISVPYTEQLDSFASEGEKLENTYC